MKIVILERNSAGLDIPMEPFYRLGEVTEYANTVTDQAAERIRDAEIIVANKVRLNEETLKDAPNVKLICLFATGYDNVDLKYCSRRGIKVANVRNYCTPAVAQHTFTMALWLLEKMSFYDNYVKSGTYGAQDRFSNFDEPFYELEGKTWGIIGMGGIGHKVASIAEAFGCHVIFYSASGQSTCTEYERVEFDELLHRSDILSLHCPLSDRTRGLIDLTALRKMKKSAILINVARGPVVNNADLYTALEEGSIAAAGLDVLEQEPITADNPLGKIKDSTKLIITPHMSWASTESRFRLIEETAKNIEAFLKGEDRNIVNA
ncbi:MAG: D-2-hydroxyacid dehydrogenase [Lachnospiraceae bacterium]